MLNNPLERARWTAPGTNTGPTMAPMGPGGVALARGTAQPAAHVFFLLPRRLEVPQEHRQSLPLWALDPGAALRSSQGPCPWQDQSTKEETDISCQRRRQPRLTTSQARTGLLPACTRTSSAGGVFHSEVPSCPRGKCVFVDWLISYGLLSNRRGQATTRLSC